MIVFTRGFPSVLPTVKEKREAGVHLFKSDVKTPENISNYLSYSLGPSILKGTYRSKISRGGRPEHWAQKGTPKRNKNDSLVSQGFLFFCCLFFAGVTSKQWYCL